MRKLAVAAIFFIGCKSTPASDDPWNPPASTGDPQRDLTAYGIKYEIAHGKEIVDAKAMLADLMANVDKLIADHEYERAMLEASKIRWPFHGVKEEKFERDYDAMRETRVAVIRLHVPIATP